MSRAVAAGAPVAKVTWRFGARLAQSGARPVHCNHTCLQCRVGRGSLARHQGATERSQTLEKALDVGITPIDGAWTVRHSLGHALRWVWMAAETVPRFRLLDCSGVVARFVLGSPQ